MSATEILACIIQVQLCLSMSTATAAGVLYEWLHFVVHTHWVPPASGIGGWLRSVRRHHMLHHMRNEDYWLSFSAPAVDKLFGTLPAGGTSVPLTDMARRAHGVQAAKTAIADGGSKRSAIYSPGQKMATMAGSVSNAAKPEPVAAGVTAARR